FVGQAWGMVRICPSSVLLAAGAPLALRSVTVSRTRYTPALGGRSRGVIEPALVSVARPPAGPLTTRQLNDSLPPRAAREDLPLKLMVLPRTTLRSAPAPASGLVRGMKKRRTWSP